MQTSIYAIHLSVHIMYPYIIYNTLSQPILPRLTRTAMYDDVGACVAALRTVDAPEEGEGLRAVAIRLTGVAREDHPVVTLDVIRASSLLPTQTGINLPRGFDPLG